MRSGHALLACLTAACSAVGLTATASAAAPSQTRICEAIAVADHLSAAITCPPRVQPQSFTITVPTPRGFKATVAYTIIDTAEDAQPAWQDTSIDGAQTILPAVGPVSGVAQPSHLYFAPGQDDAEASALVGTVIIDVVLIRVASGTVKPPLKSEIAVLLRNATGLVHAAESRASG